MKSMGVICNGAMFSDLQLNASRFQRLLTKVREKQSLDDTVFVSAFVELLHNICVHVALVNRHDKQIRTNLSRVPLAYHVTCTII